MAATLPNSAKATILVLGVLGLWSTWGRALIDGTLLRIINALHGDKPFIMPGTRAEPLKTRITGVYWPLDYLLSMLIVFFWQAVDGSHPTTSAVALYFASQHFGIVATQYMESYRRGNIGKRTIGATLWLMTFQLTAIGTSGPWYVALYLSTSPVCNADLSSGEFTSLHLADPISILLIPFSATLSYIVPVILMALRSPSFLSYNSKQLAIALWNVFPLGMAFTQGFLNRTLSVVGISHSLRSIGQSTAARHLYAMRTTYIFSMVVTCTCHIGITSISIGSILFPMIFAHEYRSAFTPKKLFLPPISQTRVSTFGEGDLGFMKWDEIFGYACIVILTFYTLRQAQEVVKATQSWLFYGGMILFCIVGGPGGMILAINWTKDELLFAPKILERKP